VDKEEVDKQRTQSTSGEPGGVEEIVLAAMPPVLFLWQCGRAGAGSDVAAILARRMAVYGSDSEGEEGGDGDDWDDEDWD
jgi:hypothetical protein